MPLDEATSILASSSRFCGLIYYSFGLEHDLTTDINEQHSDVVTDSHSCRYIASLYPDEFNDNSDILCRTMPSIRPREHDPLVVLDWRPYERLVDVIGLGPSVPTPLGLGETWCTCRLETHAEG